jgi:hypothetical protein
MAYIGDIRLGDTFDTKFCTVTTTGAPTQLAGSPVISAYPGNSTTQLTAGITLSVDFDSVTGLNNVRVVATSGNGYATATNYQLVITTGTVGGTSVVGYVVAEFSIEARSALMPTTVARTLDVSAGGEAGVDWANVGSPTTALNLSGTSTKALEPTTAGRTLDVTVTGEAGLDWANIGAPTTTVNLSGTTVGVAAALTANNDKTGYAIGAGGIANTAFAAGAIDAAAIAANAIGSSELAQSAAQEIADEVLDRDLAGGSSGNTRNVRNALRAIRNKTSIAAGTLTVTTEDDTTTAWTAAVTRTAGVDPVTEVDPA